MEEKNTSNISVINLAQYEAPKVTETTRDEWVEYGEKNNYFDWLIERFKNSTTNNSVITNISRLIYGRGIDALDSNRKPNEYAMLKGMISSKALKGIATNFKMLGNAYFQVSYNKNHTKILKVDYINTKLIRVGKCNDKGEIDSFYFSNDWSDVRRNEPTKYSAYGTSKDAIEIFCLKFDSVDMKYYSEPDYLGAIKYAILEEEIADFLVTDVQQSFSGQKVINFNNGVGTPETREIIEKSVRRRLQGAKGDKVIVAFNENKEMATTIDDIALTDAPEHYSYLATEAQSKLLNAHGVVSPMIVGITTENSGFSSNADEIAMATKVFYNQSIVPFQEAIIEALEEFLAFNGASLKLYFKRLNLMDSIEEKQQEREEANLKMSSDYENLIAGFGEDESEEWELIDSRDVDVDNETELDSQVAEWEESLKEQPTTLSKLVNFVGTGRANPNKASKQDKEIDGFYFKVRYKYEGSTDGERPFCNAMLRANKLYTREDIEKMNSNIVNKGQGHKGQAYDLFKYKGGVNCHHVFRRKTYVSTTKKASIGSHKTNQVSNAKATKFGYKVVNPKETAIEPRYMKDNGHHPDYKN